MTRVLVTATGGFLGGAIWRRLSERDDIEARAAARSDLADDASLAGSLSAWKPDVVVHAAGRTRGSDDDLHTDNVVTTRRLAEAVANASPNTGLILLSSAAQYGRSAERVPWRENDPCNPLDAYGRSKLESEAAAFTAAKRATALRIFNVVSPEPHGDQAFSDFRRRLVAAMAGPSPWRVQMGRLTAIRDFVDVADVLEAVERVIQRGVWGSAINVCTGVGRPVSALLEEVSLLLAHEIPGAISIGQSGPPPSLDWSVGDPTLCQAKLGFTPSADLAGLTRQAADWVLNARDHAHA